MKDNFSTQSDLYALYRPHYPVDLYDFIKNLIPANAISWDCGTGNGQIASQLSKFCTHIYASDISTEQINHAFKAPNITYSIQQAEKTNFKPHFFDLITVGQAIHWFKFDAFYHEVRRTLKKNGYLCVIGYGKLKISQTIDPIIEALYSDILGSYWDSERRFIDEKYNTIPFPFHEIYVPTEF